MKLQMNKLFTSIYAFLLFIVPLTMFHRTSELFEFNKLLTIYLITGLMLSVWAARVILTKERVFRSNLLLFPILLFLFSQVVSTIFSIDVWTSLFGYYGRFNGGLLSIIAYIALFLGFVSNIDVSSQKVIRTTIEKILQISIVSSFLVMLWGLPSKFGYDLSCFVFTGNLDVSCWTDQFVPTARMFSTLGQPNWLGAYIVIHIFIAMYFFLKDNIKMKYVYAAYMTFAMITVLFTRSRSALVALVFGCALIGTYFVVNRKTYLKKGLQRNGIIGLVLLFVIPLILFGTGVQHIDRYIHIDTYIQKQNVDVVETKDDVSETIEEVDGAQQELLITDSSEIRKIVWQGAYILGINNPLFGTGPETFAYAYNFVRPIEHNATSEWDYVYNKAHNEIFHYFATTGFLGLGAYMIVFGLVIAQIRHVFSKKLEENDKLLVLMLLAAYVSIFVSNFFGFSTTTMNVFYYLIPAWIVMIIYGKDMKTFKEDIEVTQDDSVKLLGPAIAAMFILWFVLQYVRADVAYARGDSLRQSQDYNAALNYLYKAYNHRPEPVYADKISQVLAQIAFVATLSGEPPSCLDRDGQEYFCIELAQIYNERSIESSSMNHLYYRTKARNNFLFYQATGDNEYYKTAIENVDIARGLAPTDPRMPYLRALMTLGKIESSEKLTDSQRQQLTDSALTSIQFAIELKDDYTSAYYLKGLIQKEANDIEGARQTFQYILDSLNPQYEQAKEELEKL